ncbi:hypothetical protein ABZ342_00290 [Amycolatopsis sp. NPDC005961]|uniref:hypothetical protein n=1 Tax=Amycolatopsis sp. NPDC005961 TaxID=3156720 RepID=UPI0033F9556C
MSSNLTGGTIQNPNSTPLGRPCRVHLVANPLCCARDLADVVGGQGDRHCRTLALIVDLDAELNHLEEGPQEIFWRLREVHRQDRQRIEERQRIVPRLVGLCPGRLVDGCQFRGQIGTLGFQVVVPPSQRLRERVIGVSVHRLPEDRLLFLDEISHGLLQLRTLSFTLVGLAGVHTCQLGIEDRSAFRAEDAVGEEGGDGIEERIFAQVERLGMAEVVVRPAAVVVARST